MWMPSCKDYLMLLFYIDLTLYTILKFNKFKYSHEAMNLEARHLFEAVFNTIYITIVVILAAKMFLRLDRVEMRSRRAAGCMAAAFALLILGDFLHLLFRMIGFARGTMDITGPLGLNLVGLGSLATYITLTLFYIVMLYAWQSRFQKPFGITGALLLSAACIRLLFIVVSGNQWSSPLPVQPWFTYRTIPFIIQQGGTGLLFLVSGLKARDTCFTLIGMMMITACLAFVPFTLFIHRYPVVGMLMVPITITYIIMAYTAYYGYFRASDSQG